MEGLLDRGFRPSSAADGAEALELARSRPFAAILSDVQMPRVDGFGLLEALQQAPHPAPVVLMSTAGGDVARRALSVGAAAYVAKPIDLDGVAGVLRRAAGLDPA